MTLCFKVINDKIYVSITPEVRSLSYSSPTIYLNTEYYYSGTLSNFNSLKFNIEVDYKYIYINIKAGINWNSYIDFASIKLSIKDTTNIRKR